MELICSRCGKQNESNSKFCFGCGSRLVAPSPQIASRIPEKKEQKQVVGTVPIISEKRDEAKDLSTRPLTIASIFFIENNKEVQIPFKAEVKIGRLDKDNGNVPDIDLTELDESNTTSRKHGSIIYLDGKYMIKDTGSMNGTFINGKKLDNNVEYPLNNGDEIMFGKLKCTFKYID